MYNRGPRDHDLVHLSERHIEESTIAQVRHLGVEKDRPAPRRLGHDAGAQRPNPHHTIRCRLHFDAAGVLLRPGRAPEVDYYPDAF